MNIKLDKLFSERAKRYIQKLSATEQGKISAQIEYYAQGEFELVETKTIDGPIKEIIIGPHRIIYFSLNSILYISDAFRKRSQKTPKNKIDYSMNVYKECFRYLKEKRRKK